MRKKRGFTLIEALAALWALIAIGLFGFGVYVLLHFVSKFW